MQNNEIKQRNLIRISYPTFEDPLDADERLLSGHEIFCSDMGEKNFREKQKEKGTKTKRGSLNISLAVSTPIKPAEKVKNRKQ